MKQIEKVNLGIYPTPIEKLSNLTKHIAKGDIYIKRDDVTGPAIGGNKTRKLEYLLKEAIDTNCTAILTTGGVQTNHGRTTVGAAIKLGLKPILVLGGEEPDYFSGNLALDALMGADIYFTGDKEESAVIEDVIKRYQDKQEKVYNIPVGGSSTLGAMGYIMAVKEIMEQIQKDDIKIDHIVCTLGSLGTMAGLILGAKYFNASFDVIGIPVIPNGRREKELAEYINKISEEFEMGITVQESDICILNGEETQPFCGEKYNKPDEITRKYIMMMAQKEAIMLDPTYTGKTFRGMIETMQEAKHIKETESVLFIHTGGMPALWTKEHLDDMQSQIKANCKIESY